MESVRPGDRVALLWRPRCGRCRHCLAGQPVMCVLGRVQATTGGLPDDGTTRLRLDGREVHHLMGVSCFAERAVVSEKSVVKVPDGDPLADRRHHGLRGDHRGRRRAQRRGRMRRPRAARHRRRRRRAVGGDGRPARGRGADHRRRRRRGEARARTQPRRHARSSTPAAMTSSRRSGAVPGRRGLGDRGGRSRGDAAAGRRRACAPAARRWRSASGAWARPSRSRSTSSCSSRSGWSAASTDPPTRRSIFRGCWRLYEAGRLPLDELLGARVPARRRSTTPTRRSTRGAVGRAVRAAMTDRVRDVSEPARSGRVRQRRRDRARARSSSRSSPRRACSVGFVDVQDDAGQALGATVAERGPPAAALPALRRARRRRAAGGDHRDRGAARPRDRAGQQRGERSAAPGRDAERAGVGRPAQRQPAPPLLRHPGGRADDAGGRPAAR